MAEYRIKRGGMHEKFALSRKKIQIIGGGFGNGKTAAGVIKAIGLAKAYPGSNGIVAMATYAQLNDTIREEMYKWMPGSAVKRWPTMANNTLVLKNGTKINFRYIQQKGKSAADGQTTSNLLSATYDWAVIDQIENPAITYKDFLDILGRLRGSTKYKGVDPSMPESGPRWLILLANPSFNWVYHKLIKPMKLYQSTGVVSPDLIVNKSTQEPMIDLFEASTYENAHNLETDFIESLEAAYTGQFRKRFLDGEWGAFEGLIYPEFDAKVHIISKEEMLAYIFENNLTRKKFKAIEGFDFGIASPSCYVFGFIDHSGRIFILDGFYKSEMRLATIAEEIIRIQNEYYPYLRIEDSIIADPAIFKRSVLNGSGKAADTINNIMSDQFNLSFRPGQNDILTGITKVSSYIGIKDFPHYNDCNEKAGIIFFADHLIFIPDEFGSYFWKTNKGLERIDQPIDSHDHFMDTLKYMLSYMPETIDLLFSSEQTILENLHNGVF